MLYYIFILKGSDNVLKSQGINKCVYGGLKHTHVCMSLQCKSERILFDLTEHFTILEPPKTHTEEFVEFENFALKL